MSMNGALLQCDPRAQIPWCDNVARRLLSFCGCGCGWVHGRSVVVGMGWGRWVIPGFGADAVLLWLWLWLWLWLLCRSVEKDTAKEAARKAHLTQLEDRITALESRIDVRI
jgi:hypothetical protein